MVPLLPLEKAFFASFPSQVNLYATIAWFSLYKKWNEPRGSFPIFISIKFEADLAALKHKLRLEALAVLGNEVCEDCGLACSEQARGL